MCNRVVFVCALFLHPVDEHYLTTGGYNDDIECSGVDLGRCQSGIWTIQPEEINRAEHSTAGSVAQSIRSHVANTGDLNSTCCYVIV